jgi:ATP phosphoribosyltransferase
MSGMTNTAQAGATGAKLTLAIPSKGRLMEQTATALARAGLAVRKVGQDRRYRGLIEGLETVEVALLSSSEIADAVRDGNVHLGVTGEDLAREHIADFDARAELIAPLGFGHADVVVAVPDCWIDVEEVADLESVAIAFRRMHGRRPRVATKYLNLARRFLFRHGVSSWLIVESLGATEGTPAAGTAEIIVDITTTGATLRANGLKVLGDGVILRSQASLFRSKAASWSSEAEDALKLIRARLLAG